MISMHFKLAFVTWGGAVYFLVVKMLGKEAVGPLQLVVDCQLCGIAFHSVAPLSALSGEMTIRSNILELCIVPYTKQCMIQCP